MIETDFIPVDYDYFAQGNCDVSKPAVKNRKKLRKD